MRIGDAQRERYRLDGWLCIEGVFSDRVVESLASVAEACCMSDVKDSTNGEHFDKDADGKFLPRKLVQPFLRHPAFGKVALHPVLRSLATTLLQKPALLVTDQVFMKPPRHGTAKPYHQDNFYFGFKSPSSVITCWIALDDADEENGCLKYINGSHVDGVVPHICTDLEEPHNLNAPLTAVEERAGGHGRPNERSASVRKGGVIFHHGATLHASGANFSNRWRRAYAVHFGAQEEHGALGLSDSPDGIHLSKTAYCLREDYERRVEAASMLCTQKCASDLLS
mmetsp:Transcript_69895/g.116080  ORF Transcript_69895/g.116080 Transcript_69895/m.116080 type:complete len:282 (-) Transcript_69895:151-996(-)